jgi:predicted amidohydrolase
MRIAALQMRAVAGDPAANLARIERAAVEAAAAGAALLVAPELAITGYGAGEAIRDLAEPVEGRVVDRLAAIAAATGLAIACGIAERDGGDVYNSAVLIEPAGRRTVYRKSHLYGPYERCLFRPGLPAAVTANLGGLKVGMLICYDVEFPENVRRLAQSGVQLVVVPTALPAGDHAAFIAQRMIPVRAFENQVFVAYVNHCGADGRFAYAGLSAIAAPDGTMLAQAGAADEALLVADIDPAAYEDSRAANTYLEDLRV